MIKTTAQNYYLVIQKSYPKNSSLACLLSARSIQHRSEFFEQFYADTFLRILLIFSFGHLASSNYSVGESSRNHIPKYVFRILWQAMVLSLWGISRCQKEKAPLEGGFCIIGGSSKIRARDSLL